MRHTLARNQRNVWAMDLPDDGAFWGCAPSMNLAAPSPFVGPSTQNGRPASIPWPGMAALQSSHQLQFPMRYNYFLIVGFAIAGVAACSTDVVRTSEKPAREAISGKGADCEALVGRRLGSGTITQADHIPQGQDLIAEAQRAVLKAIDPRLGALSIAAPKNLCRVSAELRAVPGSLVKVQVWLPDHWNGKMYASGGGGFNGGLFSAPVVLYEPTTKGYASVVTDVGHDMSNSAEFARDREKFIDYGFRGNHVTAVFTKGLINAYYGRPARFAYFVGGSNGGREALMEARRFPGDYDGIIAGMPATSFTKLVGISFLWNHAAAMRAPTLGAKLPMVTNAVLAKCDGLDGVMDQVIENPLRCKFDPAELQCKSSNDAACLNPEEMDALRSIYGGPRLKDGTQVFPGQPVGGEAIPGNWDVWITSEKSLQADMGEEFMRWMVFEDPQWSKARFDIDRDYPMAMERAAPIVDSDDPDLSGFLGRGGKLIIHQGWADAAVSPGSTLKYFDALRSTVGAIADEQVRLFMVPGMLHGPGGVQAPTDYDMLTELDRWVEGGPAPERVVASRYEKSDPLAFADKGTAIRTRPLCAWPKTAHYIGVGSTDQASNFRCK